MSESDLNEADEMIRKMETCTDSKAFGLMALIICHFISCSQKGNRYGNGDMYFQKNLMLVNLLLTDIYIARKEEDPHWTFTKMVRKRILKVLYFIEKRSLPSKLKILKWL
ncbi:MAG: hypothetical protein IPN93_04725 [Bacteroidetes bacterium]|nr:hypothetical protein [Bacteroidota bacterium]